MKCRDEEDLQYTSSFKRIVNYMKKKLFRWIWKKKAGFSRLLLWWETV